MALRPFRARATAYGRVLTANRQDQYRTVSEFIGGIKVAKSLNVEATYFAQLQSTLERIKTDNINYVRNSSIGTAAGVTREASGARSVSGARPLPVVARPLAVPGTWRGATTIGSTSSQRPA